MSDRVLLVTALTMLVVGMATVGLAVHASGWSLPASIGYPFALAAFGLMLNTGLRRLVRHQ
jgi:hypothetical protein